MLGEQSASLTSLRKLPRLVLLDVLRIVALLQVSIFHQNARLLSSGYLAVLTFFVLSAYLLFRAYIWRRYASYLDLSLRQPERKISYQECDESLGTRLHIFAKQMAKLYLPFVSLVFILTLVLFIFYPAYLAKQAATLRASLLGINNFQQLIQGKSYFRGAGFLAVFTHIWALSVEWQYYVLLFFIFIPLYQKLAKWKFRRICLILAALSQALLWVVALLPSLQERAYFASFCRSMPFFSGLFLASILTVQEYRLKRLLYSYIYSHDQRYYEQAKTCFNFSPLVARLICIISGVLLIALPYVKLNLKQFYIWQSLLYNVALVAFIVATMNLEMYANLQAVSKQMVQIDSSSRATWRMQYGPILAKLTVFSYHFYLWHFPIQAILAKASANLTWPVWLFDFVSLALSTLVSYASYRLTSAWQKNIKQVYLKVASLLLAVILLLLPYESLGKAKQAELDAIADKITNYEQQAHITVSVGESSVPKISATKSKFSNAQIDPAKLPLTDNVKSEEDRQYLAQFEQKMLTIMQNDPSLEFNLMDFENLRLNKYTILGDSIGIFLSFFVSYYLPNAELNVKSVRRMVEAANVYEQAKADGKLGDAVIALFGTNGIIQVEEVEALYKLAQADKKPLFLATVVLPWIDQETENNNLLKKFVSEHADCYLIDWHKYAKGNYTYFEADSIHPSAAGCELYMHLICKSLVEATFKH